MLRLWMVFCMICTVLLCLALTSGKQLLVPTDKLKTLLIHMELEPVLLEHKLLEGASREYHLTRHLCHYSPNDVLTIVFIGRTKEEAERGALTTFIYYIHCELTWKKDYIISNVAELQNAHVFTDFAEEDSN